MLSDSAVEMASTSKNTDVCSSMLDSAQSATGEYAGSFAEALAAGDSVQSTDGTDSKSSALRQDHSFLIDHAYVEEMEEDLLGLLDNFKKGNLNAFDQRSVEKMNRVKTLQENLAMLHFELEDEEVNQLAVSEEEQAKRSQERMDRLMKNMETLCSSIQSLHQYNDAE